MNLQIDIKLAFSAGLGGVIPLDSLFAWVQIRLIFIAILYLQHTELQNSLRVKKNL